MLDAVLFSEQQISMQIARQRYTELYQYYKPERTLTQFTGEQTGYPGHAVCYAAENCLGSMIREYEYYARTANARSLIKIYENYALASLRKPMTLQKASARYHFQPCAGTPGPIWRCGLAYLK